MLSENELERIQTDLKLDENKKSNLIDELAHLKKKLQEIEKKITENSSDLNAIEDFEKNINNAANSVQDAIIDMDGYFQGNLANDISNEYHLAEEELTEIHNKMADEYNKLNEEIAELKKQARKIEEEIAEIQKNLNRIDNSIELNMNILKNSVEN